MKFIHSDEEFNAEIKLNPEAEFSLAKRMISCVGHLSSWQVSWFPFIGHLLFHFSFLFSQLPDFSIISEHKRRFNILAKTIERLFRWESSGQIKQCGFPTRSPQALIQSKFKLSDRNSFRILYFSPGERIIEMDDENKTQIHSLFHEGPLLLSYYTLKNFWVSLSKRKQKTSQILKYRKVPKVMPPPPRK